MKKFGKYLIFVTTFLVLLLTYNNCSDIKLNGISKQTQPLSQSVDQNIIIPSYKETPSDYADPTSDDPHQYNYSAGRECISHGVNQLGVPNNNILLSRKKNPEDPQCPYDRAPYEIINGCRVYDRDELQRWSASKGLQPWTAGDHYIYQNLPAIVQQPFETVSVKIRADELTKETFYQGYSGPIFRGTVILRQEANALISVSKNPCEFTKSPKYGVKTSVCQQYGFSLNVVREDSSADYMSKLKSSDYIYGTCLIEKSDYYYINLRLVYQNDLENPNATTCANSQYCSYFLGFKQ